MKRVDKISAGMNFAASWNKRWFEVHGHFLW
jgi:hypothetical protein